jgi:WD40 repeat protein
MTRPSIIWKLTEDDGELSQSLIANQDSILALDWSPGGKRIATASSDPSIRFRDSRLDLIGVVDYQPDWVQALDFSRDGEWVAAERYDGSVRLYDSSSQKEIAGPPLVFESRTLHIRCNPEGAASR